MTWWIATVAPSLEFRAAADIRALGLDTWLPLRTITLSKRKGTSKPISRDYPQIPGYLFVQAFSSDWREDWQAMRLARDVRGILANGGKPSSLSDIGMVALQRRLATPADAPPAPVYAIGEDIRITDQASPFCGLWGEVEGTDRATVRILLDIFGRKTRVEILGDQLERVA